MTDYQDALEQVLFDRLSARVTLSPVFQHMPENQAPPATIIGDITFEDLGGKDAPLRRYTVTINTIIAGGERAPLNRLQAEVDDALDRWTPLPRDGVAFGEIQLSSGSGQYFDVDGVPIYAGEQVGSLFVLDA